MQPYDNDGDRRIRQKKKQHNKKYLNGPGDLLFSGRSIFFASVLSGDVSVGVEKNIYRAQCTAMAIYHTKQKSHELSTTTLFAKAITERDQIH